MEEEKGPRVTVRVQKAGEAERKENREALARAVQAILSRRTGKEIRVEITRE